MLCDNWVYNDHFIEIIEIKNLYHFFHWEVPQLQNPRLENDPPRDYRHFSFSQM